ncbi:MAG: SpoIIE family protein phosphatase, partial [Pseudonocardiales bacterium]|nr:SpoIIE family protein phosphatase [Pseudonocardiales bacterium]
MQCPQCQPGAHGGDSLVTSCGGRRVPAPPRPASRGDRRRLRPRHRRRCGDGLAEAEITLAAGSTLLLYTDGLVERRGSALTDDLDALITRAAAHHL